MAFTNAELDARRLIERKIASKEAELDDARLQFKTALPKRVSMMDVPEGSDGLEGLNSWFATMRDIEVELIALRGALDG